MGQQWSISVALFFGLTLAWTGTALLISPAAVRLFGNPLNLPMAFAGQGLLWAIAGGLFLALWNLVIKLLFEREPEPRAD